LGCALRADLAELLNVGRSTLPSAPDGTTDSRRRTSVHGGSATRAALAVIAELIGPDLSSPRWRRHLEGVRHRRAASKELGTSCCSGGGDVGQKLQELGLRAEDGGGNLAATAAA
jgi:hypothetical protein